MTIKVDVLGYRWDTVSVGCAFVELEGGYYFHIRMKRLYTKESFDAQLVLFGKAFQDGEVGIPTDAFLASNPSDFYDIMIDPGPPPGPPDVPGNLLTNPNDPSIAPWDNGGQGIATLLDDYWTRYTNNSATTTMSLAQYFSIGNVSVGETYRIQAYFRVKGAIGNDYRLAIAEYSGATWKAAVTTDLDIIGVDDPTPVHRTADITVANADTDRIRFAIQMVNPPQAGMYIEFKAAAGLLISAAGIVTPDLTLVAGQGSGQRVGYRRGSYGSIAPDLLTTGDEIRNIQVNNDNGKLRFKVEGEYPQNGFTSMQIVGIGTVMTADASYDYDGAESEWVWSDTGFSLTVGDTYAVEYT